MGDERLEYSHRDLSCWLIKDCFLTIRIPGERLKFRVLGLREMGR